MAGLEADNVATIKEFMWPMIQSTLASLKRHITSPKLSDDLRIMEEVMRRIPDIIQVAKSKYTNASAVSHLVAQLKKLAYDAEDLVDELSYHELHQQVLNKGGASTSKALPSMTVVTPERTQSLIKELQGVICGLKEAFDVAKELPPSVSPTTTEIPSHRVTTSTIDLKRVRGREEEKQQMMEFLTPDPLIHDQKVFFFAITGIGGVGKTTLAQYAFNNLKDRFDLPVWICVSDAFDRKRLLQEIIAGITGVSRSQHEVTSIDNLENTIKKEVKDKTLLLVLDDIWSTEWMDLLPPLQFSEAKGCKVIVTTREVKNIKQTHDYESKMLPLVGLQGEVFRRLFEEQAFGGVDPIEHGALREIGEKIARKLEGNPLAAKTVGAVLRENLEIQHWNRVVEDDLWNLGNKPEDIMPALMRSYIHLPPHLRRCFSYCALFPKDYHFTPEELVNMWIAQGYVICTNPNERLEDVGLKYIRELVSRSFFAKQFSNYTMHDLLHDLATFVSLDECFIYRQESSKSNEKALSCHHLSVDESNIRRLPADLHHIRTLIRTKSYGYLLVPEVLKSLKSVRVMDGIGIGIGIELSHDLGRLIHLRYLDLRYIGNNEIYEPLLKSICSLYHLQTLFLKINCDKECPNGMNNLINLRHLVGDLYYIAKIPSIGKLVQLQELRRFEVGKGSLYNIGQLKEMNQLHDHLTISNICQVEEVDDAKNANMEMKKYLTSLRLQWYDDEQTYCREDSNVDHYDNVLEYNVEHYDNVLEYLKPHNNLERLEISHHNGSKPPSWLAPHSLQCIKDISLLRCNNWRRVSHLAQLSHLQSLTMEGMDLVVDLADQGYLFPSLKELYLKNMSVIFEDVSKEGLPSCQVFPKLSHMDLDSYKNLESITRINDLSNLTYLFLSDSKFTSFNAEVMGSLKALKILLLDDCFRLKSLPDPPSTLKDLTIGGSYDKELEVDLGRIRLTSNGKIIMTFNSYDCWEDIRSSMI